MLIIFLNGTDSQALEVNSGRQQLALLELYTSQGCSSCPPADRFLSTLKNDKRLWKKIVPIALHVNYWDYIGWKDPFARQQHTKRQHQYHQHGNINSVYTPGFILNGQEWRGYFKQRDVSPDFAHSSGNLHLSASPQEVNITFHTEQAFPELKIHVALLGMDMQTSIKRGENSGKILKEDFVTLQLKEQTMKKSGNSYSARFKPLSSKQASDHKTALVAWVTREDDPTPIQAVGGYHVRETE